MEDWEEKEKTEQGARSVGEKNKKRTEQGARGVQFHMIQASVF